MVETEYLKRMVYSAAMAGMIAVGAFIAVPVGPVPIVLQNMFVYLTGLLLGWRWGLAAVGVYLLAGMLGLPVFAGGTSGFARLLGPTGGYLAAYLPVVCIIGLTAEKTAGGKCRAVFDMLGMLAGTVVLYGLGVTWLKIVTGMSLSSAVLAGVLPFLPGDGAKMVVAVILARTVRPMLDITPGPVPDTRGAVSR